jgi:microcystin-dependent protein
MDSKNNFNINMIVILFILFYILYVLHNLKNKEYFNTIAVARSGDRITFGNNNTTDLNVENLRLFSNVAKVIQDTGSLTVENNLDITNKNHLNVNGTITTNNDIVINKNLTVEGTINLLPKGIIVAWTSDVAPLGWALCDGQNNTPDLRSRFILSSGQGVSLTKRENRQIGGTETETLTYLQLPPVVTGATGGVSNNTVTDGGNRRETAVPSITNQGNNQPHNNMPPFYVLTYIVKL